MLRRVSNICEMIMEVRENMKGGKKLPEHATPKNIGESESQNVPAKHVQSWKIVSGE